MKRKIQAAFLPLGQALLLLFDLELCIAWIRAPAAFLLLLRWADSGSLLQG
jgi:hypothetical protein